MLFLFFLSLLLAPRQARIAADLIELRNKSVFAFFMFNALFVLIVFLLQLNKDQLHVVWPLGVRTNITYIEETSEVSGSVPKRKTKMLSHWQLGRLTHPCAPLLVPNSFSSFLSSVLLLLIPSFLVFLYNDVKFEFKDFCFARSYSFLVNHCRLQIISFHLTLLTLRAVCWPFKLITRV